jgi:hypothetical protein
MNDPLDPMLNDGDDVDLAATQPIDIIDLAGPVTSDVRSESGGVR